MRSVHRWHHMPLWVWHDEHVILKGHCMHALEHLTFDNCCTVIKHMDMKSSQSVSSQKLCKACLDGKKIDVVDSLNGGADPNSESARGFEGQTPLHYACQYGWLDIVQLLVEDYNCAVEARTNRVSILNYPYNLLLHLMFSEVTPLHTACKHGKVEVAIVLIEKYQCNPNVVSSYGSTPLHFALDCNHTDLATELVTHGANPEIADSDGNTPLHKACYNGQLYFVKYLLNLQSKCNVNVKNNAGETPLHVNLCSSKYNSDITKELVTCGASTKEVDEDGDTPLHTACCYGRLNSVKYLVAVANCNPNALNKASLTPIHLSLCSKVESSHVGAIIEHLFEHGANLSMTNGSGDTPLHMACQIGEVVSVICLLATAKCDPNAKNKAGLTPLLVQLRSACNDSSITKMLIACGANPNSTDKNGDTPLHTACYYGRLDDVKYLLVMGKCDPNVLNKARLTPIHLSLNSPSHVDTNIIKHLIEHGANLSVTNSNGDTPLHMACQTGELESVKCLLATEKCDPNAKNNARLTPLQVLFPRHFEIAKQLIDHGANPKVADGDRNTPLHKASFYGQLDSVKYFLVEGKCNPNMKNNAGSTPLNVLSRYATCDILKELIAHGGNPNTGDKDGNTPLHKACFYGRLDFVKCLLAVKGCDPNSTNKTGLTPLYFNMNLECNNTEQRLSSWILCSKTWTSTISDFVQELIDHGANPNVSDIDGNTPLHYACYLGHLEFVKCLLQLAKSDPNVKNKAGLTPLQANCSQRCADSNIIRVLITYGANPNVSDSYGNTPLHKACEYQQPDCVKCLLAEGTCDPNFRNKNGESPLHLNLHSRRSSYIDITKELLAHGANPNITDRYGNTPLHGACYSGKLYSVKCLTNKCDVNIKNKAGYTPLHSNLSSPLYSDAEITKEVILRGANPNVADNKGNTPVHIACQSGRLNSVTCLLAVGNSDTNVKNEAGDTPLHIILKSPMYCNSDVVEDFITHGANANEVDSDGNTPLHIACKTERLDSVKYLLLMAICDPNARNKAGQTPLHVCVKCSNPQVVFELITHGAKSNLADNKGNTPLHVSCQSATFDAVKCLLTTTDCDPNVKNKNGLTPLQLTSIQNTKIVKELIRHGANANDVYKSYRRVLKRPIQPPVKVFVVGNPSVGKSTLTSALQKEKLFVRPFTKPQKVTGVDTKTAGIVPHEFESREYGYTTFYDFAGQRQFYGSHAAILQNAIQSSPPIFLIVVDICESEEEITKNVRYWLSFVDNQCSLVSSKPHVIIIGSHADVLKERGEDLELKCSFLRPNTKEFSSKFVFAGFIVMDCQYPISAGINELRQCLKNSCSALRMRETITFNAHCFYVYLVDTFRDSIAVSIEQIQMKVKSELPSSENSIMSFIPHNLHHLYKICIELNDRGHILFLKDSEILEQSWVVLDKKCLLSKVSGSIFAPDHFKQHIAITQCMCSTGVVSLSSVASSFPEYNPILLTKFLSCLEFCNEISDPEVLHCITAEHQACVQNGPTYDLKDRYFLFPSLVSLNIPTNVWDHKPQCTLHCGWVLHCSSEAPQFFTPRFLQVLLLRMATAYSFPLSEEDKMKSNPAIQRNCSIWKNGIFWSNYYGVETLVEVNPDNKAVIILMRCCDTAIVNLVQLRSQVIRQVNNAVKMFCCSIQTIESMIEPSQTTTYPLKPVSQLKLFSVSNISTAIVKSNAVAARVVSPTGFITIENLLQYEPYAGLGEDILWELFENGDQIVPDSFLTRLVEQKAQQLDTFIKMFYPDHEPQNTATPQDCISVLQAWRMLCTGTYTSLRGKLDEFSVFAGRSPLTLAGVTERQQQSKPKEIVWDFQPSTFIQNNEDDPSRMEALPLKGDKPTIELLHVIKYNGKRVKVIESVAAEWEELAIALEFEAPVINYLKRDFNHNSVGAATQVLTKWMCGESDLDKPITWDTLIESLDNAGQAGLAEDLTELLKGNPANT